MPHKDKKHQQGINDQYRAGKPPKTKYKNYTGNKKQAAENNSIADFDYILKINIAPPTAEQINIIEKNQAGKLISRGTVLK